MFLFKAKLISRRDLDTGRPTHWDYRYIEATNKRRARKTLLALPWVFSTNLVTIEETDTLPQGYIPAKETEILGRGRK